MSNTGRSVTANMPVLGTGDSGFESRRPDMSEASESTPGFEPKRGRENMFSRGGR